MHTGNNFRKMTTSLGDVQEATGGWPLSNLYFSNLHERFLLHNLIHTKNTNSKGVWKANSKRYYRGQTKVIKDRGQLCDNDCGRQNSEDACSLVIPSNVIKVLLPKWNFADVIKIMV